MRWTFWECVEVCVSRTVGVCDVVVAVVESVVVVVESGMCSLCVCVCLCVSLEDRSSRLERSCNLPHQVVPPSGLQPRPVSSP